MQVSVTLRAMLAKYEPSGIMGALTPLTLIVLLPIAAGGAWLYQVLISWIPFIYINFFIMLGYAVLLAVSNVFVLRLAKCRNQGIAAAIGAVVGLFGLGASHFFAYTAHVFDGIGVVWGQGGPPVGFSDYISEKVAQGWSVGRLSSGIAISGFFVWAIWVIEGIAIVLVSLGGGVAAAETPFCEKCGCRANKKAGEFSVTSVSPATVERVREAGSVREMLADSGGGASSDKLTYKVTRCPSCDGLTTLEIEYESVETKDGNETKNSETLHEGLLLSEAEAKVYLSRAK